MLLIAIISYFFSSIRTLAKDSSHIIYVSNYIINTITTICKNTILSAAANNTPAKISLSTKKKTSALKNDIQTIRQKVLKI